MKTLSRPPDIREELYLMIGFFYAIALAGGSRGFIRPGVVQKQMRVYIERLKVITEELSK